jgi:regulator of sigma E protease
VPQRFGTDGLLLMAWLIASIGYIVPFLLTLTVLVFVHELGHYLVARRNRVRVEVFSIGFGPELFGWNDRAGTRWKFSAIPFGGYVKMFGDADPASMPGERVRAMTAEERAVSFHHKRLPQRVAVVAAGPLANFLFAVVLLTLVIAVQGQRFTPPEIGQVVPNSAAEAAGIKAGDVIVSIDGQPIDHFEAIQRIVELNTGTPLDIVVRRGDRDVPIRVTPRIVVEQDRFGFDHQVTRLGVAAVRNRADYVHRNPLTAPWYAAQDTWNITADTLQAVWQMLIGKRSSNDVSGPIGIVQLSGAVAQGGIIPLLGFAALLSINLGLINLFPIPVLDGGHLLFYVAEAIRGRPLSPRAQEYGFRLGLALVLTLMVFATWNDLVRLKVVEFIKGLVT